MQKVIDNIFYIEMSKEAIFDSAKYIIDTHSNDGLIIIDPGLYIKFFSELIENKLDPKAINHCLITHAHLDHFGACNKLRQNNSKIKFYVHEDDVFTFENIADPELLRDYYPGYEFTPVKASYKVRNNQLLTFGDLEIKCLHTPGHSPGASAFFIEMEGLKILFAGDIGGTALEHSGGNIEDYIKSMHKLIDIKPDILCEGHEGPIRPRAKAEEFIKNCVNFNQLFQKAIEVDPLNTSTWYNLAMQVYDLKDYGFALDACNYLLEMDPLHKEGKELKKLIEEYKPPKVEFIKTILKRREKFLQTR